MADIHAAAAEIRRGKRRRRRRKKDRNRGAKILHEAAINKAGQRGCTYVFLMSECAFLFHIETVNDPSSDRDNTPVTSSSAIRPLLR